MTLAFTPTPDCRPQDRPEPEGNIQLPYGLAANGTLIHIEDVGPAGNGLKCGCTCPGCGEPLVAHNMGKVKRPHFKHHVNRACSSGLETALHLLAKQVVTSAREIWLPPAVARVGTEARRISEGGALIYDAVETEVVMSDLKPDAVLVLRGRNLLVEFRVHHGCDDEKRAKLARDGLGCIEIDLRGALRGNFNGARHLASRAAHVDFILRTAPRDWAFNSKVAAAEADLRAELAKVEAKNRARLQQIHGRLADRIAAVWDDAPAIDHPSWGAKVRDCGWGDWVDLEVPGAGCMSVGTVTWQAAILRTLLHQMQGHDLTANFLAAELADAGMLKAPFTSDLKWDDDMVGCVREAVPGFRFPAEVVGAYADQLVGLGVLKPTRKAFRAVYEVAVASRSSENAAAGARKRVADLRKKLVPVVDAAGEADVAAWAIRALPGEVRSPTQIAEAGGDAWEVFSRKLVALVGMLSPHGTVVAEDGLLGLPLGSVRRVRMEEAEMRQAEIRRDRENWERQADERMRQDSVEFTARICLEADAVFGEGKGRTWLDTKLAALPEVQHRDEGRLLYPRDQDRIEASLRDERYRRAHAEAAEIRRIQDAEASEIRKRVEAIQAERKASPYRTKLRSAAMAALKTPERTEFWLKAPQRGRGMNQGPLDYCRDDSTYRECLNLLRPSGRG